jgi:hypothetical protein
MREIFVREGTAVDRLSTCPIPFREIYQKVRLQRRVSVEHYLRLES